MKHSEYQLAIFDAIENTDRNIVVQALAGTGKTSTVIESLRFIPADKYVLMCAFNKDIATELEKRIPAHLANNVKAQTFNSIGHQSLPNLLGHRKLNLFNGKKSVCVTNAVNTYSYMNASIADREFLLSCDSSIKEVLSFACRMGIVPLEDEVFYTVDSIVKSVKVNKTSTSYKLTKECVLEMIDKYAIDCDSELLNHIVPILNLALIGIIRDAMESGTIDFDDQIYLPCVLGTNLPKYDFVFVDECQDLSPLRLELIGKLLHDKSRIIFVGDANQCLYGFTGSDIEIFDSIEDRYNPVSLPLNTTYRCAKSIVLEANTIVPALEAANTAIDGDVSKVDMNIFLNTVKNGDVVICRCNAPIVSLAWRMFDEGFRIRILGKDIGANLINLIKRQGSKVVSVMLARLDEYVTEEVKRLNANKKEAIAASLQDKAQSIVNICSAMDNRSTVDDVINAINSRFADKGDSNALIFSTIHKSKGLEFDTVWFLNSSMIPLKHSKSAWQLQQESNCKYVAITRAKTSLRYLEIKK